jgi:hypothetical protein
MVEKDKSYNMYISIEKTRLLPNPRREAIATYPVFEVIWGQMDHPTDGPTNIVSYRGATSRLKM